MTGNTPSNPSNSTASKLIGPRPTGSIRTISLAVGECLKKATTQPNDQYIHHFLLACSGGADSLALTVAAADWLTRHGFFPRAIIIDHQLRETSAAEARQTSTLLNRLQIANTIIPVEVTAGSGLEASARAARYQAFMDYAAQNHPTENVGVLLGHTVDDQAETVLLGLARGSGTRAIAGMPAHFVNEQVIRQVENTPRQTLPFESSTSRTLPSRTQKVFFYRPLLQQVRRADTEAFCHTLQLEYIDDPSNFLDGPWRSREGEPLPRVALRHRVLPALTKALHQDVIPALAKTAQLAAADAQFIEDYAAQRFHSGEIYAGGEVNIDALEKEKKPVRMRLWKLIFAAHSPVALTSRHLEQLDRLLTDWRGQGPVSLPDGWTARREKLVTRVKQGGKWVEVVHKRLVLECCQ